MYREVTMIEVREVLRLRGEGLPKKRIAAQLGLDPKTVRRYLTAAQDAGVRVTATITDEVRQVLLALHPTGGRPRGDGWPLLEHRAPIARWLGDGLRLTKIRKLLVRQGIEIAYPTLHRFAVLELQFGKTATTIPVLDGEPGQEPTRYRMGRLAHADRTKAPALSRVDLYGGALPAPLRLSHLRGNDRARHRGV